MLSSVRNEAMAMSRRVALALLFCACLHAFAQQTSAPSSLSELRRHLAAHIEQPKFAGATWGVKIVSLETGKTFFEHNSQKLFSPASNCKLYTVAAGLDRLGPDYKIRTSI